MDFVPRQALLVQLLHEGIGIEFLDVVNAWLLPQTLAEHHGTNHSWNTSGVAYALHSSLLICVLMLAVVVNVVCLLLAIFQTANTATDGCLALVVLAKLLWVWKNGLEELKRNNLTLLYTCSVSLWRLVLYLVDT